MGCRLHLDLLWNHRGGFVRPATNDDGGPARQVNFDRRIDHPRRRCCPQSFGDVMLPEGLEFIGHFNLPLGCELAYYIT